MSRQNLARRVFLLFYPFFLFIIGISANQSEIYQAPKLAPINEQYLSFFQNLSLHSRTILADDGHPLGLIPSILDRSYLKYSNFISSQLLPTAYDLRNQNRLTPVRDQKGCGSCWAFASFGSLESTLMPLEKKDYSEQHLISEHLYDWGPCYGGNIDIATAYLSRWSGPIKESDLPYPYFINLLVNENALSVKKHIQNVIYLLPRLNSIDNDRIKNAVINYGGIYTTMYYNSSFYNSINKSYYNFNNRSGSHAVVIIGWDDYYDRSKFAYIPPGNGAFIVRNSCGTNWGDKGYFYISYYDAYLGRENVNAAVTAEPATAYNEIYQYDPLGWTTSFGYRSNTAWFANIFVSRSSLPLNAVSFYCAGTTNYYEIYIYVNPVVNKPKSGTLVAAKTGEIGTLGYYTISLDNPISLNPNQRFSVVVRLQTQNYDYPIPAEYRFNGYSSRASANSNESFVSSDGNSWYDIHTSWDGIYANTNVCLKAFAGYSAVYPPSNLTLERLTNDFIFFNEYINRLSWEPNSKNKYSIVKYRIYKKNIDADEIEFSILAELLSDNIRFVHRGLRKDERYCYGISSIDELGRESDIVEINN